MARLRDLKVGMKVEIVRGKEHPEDFCHLNADKFVGLAGEIEDIARGDRWSAATIRVKTAHDISAGWWYPASWIKIIKDEGETKMTQKTKVKQEVTPQKYILIDDNDITRTFTDVTTAGICKLVDDEWGFDADETLNRLSSGKMKIFKIEEVKLEITQPSIKIVG